MINEKDKTTANPGKLYPNYFARMKKDEVLDSATFGRIRPTGTTILRLYGLPKIHKKDASLKLI